MNTQEMISTGFSFIMMIVAIYFLINPEKVQKTKLNLSPIKIRIIMGVALSLMIGPQIIKFKLRQEASHSGLTPEQSKDIIAHEKIMTTKLEQYSAEIQSSNWTAACQKINSSKIIEMTPNMPQTTADLTALASCACMASILNDIPEFKNSEALLGQGKSFEEAMDMAFTNYPGLMDKIKPCI